MSRMHSVWLYHKFKRKCIFIETFLGCQKQVMQMLYDWMKKSSQKLCKRCCKFYWVMTTQAMTSKVFSDHKMVLYLPWQPKKRPSEVDVLSPVLVNTYGSSDGNHDNLIGFIITMVTNLWWYLWGIFWFDCLRWKNTSSTCPWAGCPRL